MGRVTLSVLGVLTIIYLVPFVVYGLTSVLVGLQPPQGVAPLVFLMSVFVSKVGTAIAFVWLFYLARVALSGQWLIYACAWWVMFVVGEAGQAIGPNYCWLEAPGGAISETIYFPLSAVMVRRPIKGQ